MKFIQPEKSIADKKIFNFISSIIEYQAFPIRMESLFRILMFIQLSSVKKRQPKFILGKM